MATEVGAVFVRLGFNDDDKGFRDWESNVVRAQQVKDINARLGAEVDPRAFDTYYRKLDETKAKVARRDAFKASLGAEYDGRAFAAFERDLQKAEREAQKKVEAQLAARVEHRGFDEWGGRVKDAREQARRDVEAKLGANVDRKAFAAYERELRAVESTARRRQAFEATLGAKFDPKAFAAYERAAAGAQNKTGLLARVFGLFSGAARDAEDAVGGGGGGGLAARVGGLSGAIGPVLGVLAALIPLLVAAAGAATALSASLAAAVAGAAAVGIGLGAALGPLAAIAGAVVQRVGLISDAYSALDDQQTKSGSTAKQQAQAQNAAAQQVKAAEQGLADAQRQVVRAQDELTQARFRARREVQDLAVALDRTNLSEQRANLNLEDAVKRLAEVQADPTSSSFDLRDASLAVKEARESLKEARIERNRAITDAKRGTDTVKAAETQLADARRGAARAAGQVAQAQTAAAAATDKQGEAATGAQEKLSKLTATERGLLATVRKTIGTVTKTLQPATDAIFGGADRALQTLTPVIGRFRGRFKEIGDTVGDVVAHAAKSLAGPEWGAALDSFVATAQKIVKPIGDTLGSVAVIVRNIAVAAQPFVRELANQTAAFFGGIADKTGDAGRMRDIIASLVEHTKTWAHFGASVAKLLFTIFNSGARDGKSLVETLTHLVDRWTKFLSTKEGQERLRKFFRDSIDAIKAIGKAILTITPFVGGLILKVIEIVGWFGKHRTASTLLIASLTALAIAFGGPITQLTAIGFALVTAYNKSHTFRVVVEAVFQSVRKVIGEFANFYLGFITTFLGGLSSIATAGSHLPFIGDKFKGMARGIDNARDSIDKLREHIRDATDPMGAFAKAAEDMHRKSYRSFSDLRKDSLEQLHRIKSGTLDESQQAKDALAGNFRVAADAVQRQTRRMGGSTQDALKKIHTLMVDALHAYGLKAEDANKLFPNYEDRVAGGLAAGPPSPKARGGRVARRAAGGWIGSPGEAGPDSVFMHAPVGAAVLNRHQLPYAAVALAGVGATLDDVGLGYSTGGVTAPVAVGRGEFMIDPGGVGLLDQALSLAGAGGLDNLFAAVTTPHYLAGGGIVSGDTDYGPQMARALNALAAAYGKPIFVQSGGRTMAEQAALVRQKGLYSSSNPTGAAAPSPNAPHIRGVAADITPGREALAGLAGRFGLGFPLPSEPWHIQLLDSLGASAGRAMSAGASAARRVIPNVKVDSHGGLLTLIGQGATNIARRGAQRLLDRVRPQVTGSEPAPTAGRAGSSGQVRSWLAQALRLAGVPASTTNINTLYGRVMQESGGNPHAINLTDSNARAGHPSKGLLQTIPGTFDAYKVPGHNDIYNPVDNAAAAIRYMLARYHRLVGAGPGGYARGGRVQAFAPGGHVSAASKKKLASHATAHGPGTHLRLLSLDSPPKDRIAAYDDLTASIDDDRKLYEQADRRYNLTDEVLVDPDTGQLNVDAINHKAGELTALIEIRQRILARLRQAAQLAQRIIDSYKTAITRLTNSLKHAKKKDRSGIRGQLDQANEALTTWRKTKHDLGFDITDADLDVQEIIAERAAVLGTQPENRTSDTSSSDTTATADSATADTTTAAAPPSPADIAASAIADVANYLTASQQSLSGYASNFITPFRAASPSGLFSGAPDQLAATAGAKFLGTTGDADLGGAAGRSVVIHNTYQQLPDNTATWSSQMRFQIEAAVG